MRHDTFGSGVVMSVDGDEITVLFDEVGYRTLSLPTVLRAPPTGRIEKPWHRGENPDVGRARRLHRLLLAGSHEYLFLPPDPAGRGGLARYQGSAPPSARECSAAELRDDPPDLVLLQRLEEVDLCRVQLARTPGVSCRRSSSSTTRRRPTSPTPTTRWPMPRD